MKPEPFEKTVADKAAELYVPADLSQQLKQAFADGYAQAMLDVKQMMRMRSDGG